MTSYNIARVFVPGKPFQPSLMFVGEATLKPELSMSFCSTNWPRPT